MGPFRTLSSSDCHPAGPAGPYVAGGPVGPDVSFQVLDPLEHSVLDHADPAGQHAAVGPVGPFRTLSSSDCHPAGPAGPYVAGGPVGPDDLFKVLEPLEHSVLDHADPAGQHAVVQDVLEPLEHLVLDVTLDGGFLEEMSDWELLMHSVLNVTLDGRPMEGIPDPEPLEHSVLVMALDSGLTEGMSHLEPLEHSVLNASLVARPMEGTPDREPLEHSVLNMALDDGLAQESGKPTFGSDRGLTSTEIPDAMRTVDLGLGAAVLFPADDVDRVALPPAEARFNDSDMCIADIHTEGFRCWNTDRDIWDQYGTFNGLPVYYGGDLYDSEDSEWEDPDALASAAYVEDYNFDVPEGMDLMVHSQSRLRDGSEAQQDDHTDMVPCVRWCHVSRRTDGMYSTMIH